MDIVKKSLISIICGVVALAAIGVAFTMLPGRASELQTKLDARKQTYDTLHSLLTKPRQIVVTIVVAVVETLLRLGREIHAPYYALFIVFPVTNMLEITWDALHPKPAKPVAVPPVVSSPIQTGIAAAERPAS